MELISNCASIPEAQISFTSGGRALIIQPFGNLVVANIVVSLTGRISLRDSVLSRLYPLAVAASPFLSLPLPLSLSLVSKTRIEVAEKEKEKRRGHVRNSKWTGSQRWERRKKGYGGYGNGAVSYGIRWTIVLAVLPFLRLYGQRAEFVASRALLPRRPWPFRH